MIKSADLDDAHFEKCSSGIQIVCQHGKSPRIDDAELLDALTDKIQKMIPIKFNQDGVQ